MITSTQAAQSSTSRLLKELASKNVALKSSQGLSQKEATHRLKKFGPNEIKENTQNTWIKILAGQFTNIMVIILIVASVVSFFLGEHIDAAAIGIIILLNAVVGFIQEYRAEKAVEALKSMTAPRAIVIRNGQTIEVDAKSLVPGDILVLEEGARVPADARLLELAQLKCIEASLTGESEPESKNTEALKKAGVLGDLKNMVFMGTVISQGHAKALVTATGMSTEFGKIAHMVQSTEDGLTPLQKQLNKLSKTLAALVLGIIALLFVVSLVTGGDLVEMFILSVSLAVSVIPEGLPAVITLTLAIGVQRIAKRKAIMRKLPAAETLGSTSAICSDKTGTLTQNQMTVERLYINGHLLSITGSGYQPKGKFLRDEKPLNLKKTLKAEPELQRLLTAAALCNNAELLENEEVLGDPTEACLLTLSEKATLSVASLKKNHPRLDELVFDSTRKRMSTLHKSKDGPLLFTKGAPQAVLNACTHIEENGKVSKLTAAKRRALLKVNSSLAKDAYRVLAFAYKKTKAGVAPSEDKLIFLGMAGMMDPPRPEVKEAIAKCRSAHIHVAMITGDHALTAQAIGEKIGLYHPGDKVLTGEELEKLSDRELNKIVEKVRIYARVNPEHKVKILRALQKKGHIVAMTGDGVNDAPALQHADIGIAMGITGTDVAKEASEMVLIDDNFATIVTTIEEGRNIYRNIKKFIRFLLSANFDEVLVISIVFMLGLPLPFLPLQILWVNLLTDALPAIALGVDTPDKDIMKLKPRNPKASLWRELLSFSALAGVLSTAASMVLYFHFLTESSIEHTRTILFTYIVIFELFLVFSVRHANKHYFTSFFKNRLLLLSILMSLGLQMLAIYHPALQKVLETEPLSAQDWLWMVSFAIGAIIIIEIWKQFRPTPEHV